MLRASTYEFRCLQSDPEQATVALLMPPSEQITWQDGDLFSPMDQNLPEGDLFMRIRELFPKQPVTPMHMLALVGRNDIGRLGCGLLNQGDVAERSTSASGGVLSPANRQCRDLWPHRDGLQCVKVSTWKLTEAVLCGADRVSSHLLQSGWETMVFTEPLVQ